jgi:mevalonate kinase
MTAFSATASGKIILFGEHAVVYGQPAIAVPVNFVQARAGVTAAPRSPAGAVHLMAPDVGLDTLLADLPADDPLVLAITLTASQLNIPRLPAMEIRLTSTIPVAAGFGSSAATSIALIRALAAFIGQRLSQAVVSDLAYQVECRHHGNPSGIDNTVITYGRPVYFVRGQPFEPLEPAQPLTLVIGDSGVQSSTGAVVADVRRLHEAQNEQTQAAFQSMGELARQARTLIQAGQVDELGRLMNRNHALLRSLTISSPELDRLVDAALAAGALGAKLSGGGRGGNMIALVTEPSAGAVEKALRSAGAVRTWVTTVNAKCKG